LSAQLVALTTRTWRVVFAAVALILVLALPAPAGAAISNPEPPIIENGQVTISWVADGASSELLWDTTRHDTFEEFPSTGPNNVSNMTGTGDSGVRRHSRTISNLPVGTYWYMVKSGSDPAIGPFNFQITLADLGGADRSWQTANIVPGTLTGTASITQSTFAASGADDDTGTLWMAGSFDRIGRPSPPAVTTDANGRSQPGMPTIDGTVETTISDNEGGSYIGGSFTSVAGIPMHGVAHLLPDGGLDTTFRPGGVGIQPINGEPADAKAVVYALGLDTVNAPNVRLYVGGRFDSWTDADGASTTVHNLVAINPSGIGLGQDVAPQGTVGARLPAGKFDVGAGTSGLVEGAWNTGEVRAIVVDQRKAEVGVADDTNNSGVYLGGRFSRVNAKLFSKVAKLELNGAPAQGKGECVGTALMCGLGDALYGDPNPFETPQISTGAAPSDAAVVYSLAYWDPRYNGPIVYDLASARYQPELMVGGSFDTVKHGGGGVGDDSHQNFVVLDSLLGASSKSVWFLGQFYIGGYPTGYDVNGPVRSLRVVSEREGVVDDIATGSKYDGDAVYLGGDFTKVNGIDVNHIARMRLAPIPDATDTTQAMRDSAYSVDPTFQPPLPDTSTQSVTSLMVQCDNAWPTCGASDMDPGKGSGVSPTCQSIYIAGSFTYAHAGQHYANLMRTDCATGKIADGTAAEGRFPGGTPIPAFLPGQAIDAAPKALAYTAGSSVADGHLFVGGDFSMYEGRMRPGIAALRVVDGKLSGVDLHQTASDPPSVFADEFEDWGSGFDGDIDAMSAVGDTLYAAGSFDTVNGVTRHNIVQIEAGEVTGFDPSPDARVRAVLAPVDHTDRVWIGGDFGDLGTCSILMDCAHLELLRSDDGTPYNDTQDPLGPTPSPDDSVRTFATGDSKVFVGGDFQKVGDKNIATVAAFDEGGHLIEDSPINDEYDGSGAPDRGERATALAYDDEHDALYVGGVTTWAGTGVHGLVKVDTTTAQLDPGFDQPLGDGSSGPVLDSEHPVDENTVRTLAVVNGRVLVGGAFTNYNGTAGQSYIATVSTTNGTAATGFTTITPPDSGDPPVVTTITQIGDTSTIIGGTMPNFDGRTDVGGFVSVDSPIDFQPPNLRIVGSGAPLPVRTQTDADGNALVVVPFPSEGAPDWSVQLTPEAQDSYTTNLTTDATTSGLKSVEFGAAPSSWVADAATGHAAAPSGLDVKCGGIAMPRTAQVELPDGATSGCIWTGRIGAPTGLTGPDAAKVFFQMSGAAVEIAGAAVGSDWVPLTPGTSAPIKVTQIGSASPTLAWKLDGQTSFQAVPAVAFSGESTLTRTYRPDPDHLPAIDGDLQDLHVTATDFDGNVTDRVVKIAADGAKPAGASVTSTEALNTTTVYPRDHIALSVITAHDVGAATLASQILYIQRRDLDTGTGSTAGQCVGTPGPLVQLQDLGTDEDATKSADATSLTTGCYRIVLVATDKVGNHLDTTLDGKSYADDDANWIHINTSSVPGGGIDTPSRNSVVKGTVTVAGTAIVGGGSANKEVKVLIDDDTDQVPLCAVAPCASDWSYSWATGSVPDGAHELTLVVTNVAGKTSSVTVVVVVDNDDPIPSSLEFTPDSGASNQAVDPDDPTKLWVQPNQAGSVHISMHAGDGAGTGVSSVAAVVASDTWNFGLEAGGTAVDGTWSYDYSWPHAGQTEPGLVTATLHDDAGHVSDQKFTVAFDADAPTNSTQEFAVGSVVDGVTDSVRIDVTLGDDGSGSGITGSWLQRVQGTLDDTGVCGSYPPFPTDPTVGAVAHDFANSDSFVDATAAPDTCYRYALVVRDLLGNQTAPQVVGDVRTSVPALITDTDVHMNEGSATTFGVHLRARPAVGESVAVTVTAGAHTTVADPAPLITFTHDDWNVVQQVSVAAIDDLVARGAAYTDAVTLHISTSGSSGPVYSDVADVHQSISIVDNDVATLALVPGTGWIPSADGSIPIKEGSAGVGIDVRSSTRPTSDVVITPVLPANSQVTVTPVSATIPAGATEFGVAFVISAVDDELHEDASTLQLTWRVETADTLYASVASALSAAKLSIIDDDAAEPKREPRVAQPPAPPVTPSSKPDPTPSADPQPPTTRTPPVPPAPVAPQPTAATPKPVPTAPVEQPRTPPTRHAAARPVPEEEGSLAKLGKWAKQHKTAVASTGIATTLGLAKLLAGVLNNMPKGLGSLADRAFGQRKLLGRAAREIVKRKRQRLLDGSELRARRKRRGARPDILDELQTKYQPDYDDPLASFERAPGADRPDLLSDLEARLDGFHLDDAA
jgi:hypothetical protein